MAESSNCLLRFVVAMTASPKLGLSKVVISQVNRRPRQKLNRAEWVVVEVSDKAKAKDKLIDRAEVEREVDSEFSKGQNVYQPK